jgi:hypothetical protein
MMTLTQDSTIDLPRFAPRPDARSQRLLAGLAIFIVIYSLGGAPLDWLFFTGRIQGLYEIQSIHSRSLLFASWILAGIAMIYGLQTWRIWRIEHHADWRLLGATVLGIVLAAGIFWLMIPLSMSQEEPVLFGSARYYVVRDHYYASKYGPHQVRLVTCDMGQLCRAELLRNAPDWLAGSLKVNEITGELDVMVCTVSDQCETVRSIPPQDK